VSRGQLQVRDPAEAVAMAKCWLATWARGSGLWGLPDVNSFHPSTCGYCEMDRPALMKMVTEFVEWSGVSSYDESVPLRLEIEAWETVGSDEQKRRVEQVAEYD
jgi:hypothetical protein